MTPDDRTLISECLAGRSSAFGELVRRHQDRLFQVAYRLTGNADDALDVVQDAFLHAYQSLDHFKGDAQFFTWMYRIAVNGAISQKRKRRMVLSLHQGPTDGQDGETVADPQDRSVGCDPGHSIERAEEDARLYAAMARLSPEFRTVLVLKDIEGQKYEDIADILGVPIGTVRSRLHRARLELRDFLMADGV